MTAIAQARRRAELGLLVLAVAVTGGAYTLASLGQTSSVPANILPFLGIVTALFFSAHLAIRKLAPEADGLLFPLVALLNGIGYVFIARVKPSLAANQATWTFVGIAAFILTLAFVRRARDLERYRYTFLVGGLVLLVLPMVPGLGVTINGARIWVALGPVSFQPGEFAKLFFALFFASYLVEKRELLSMATWPKFRPVLPDLKHLGPVLLAWGMAILVMTGLVRGDVAMRWEQRGKALVGELVWAPEGAPRGEAIEHAKVPLSARGSWRSPMGPKVDEAAAECLRQGGQVLSQGLSAATTMERDRLGLALAKVLVEAEPSLACAAKDEDTAAAAAGLRRMAVELTADVMMGAHQYEAALSMLSTQCELSKDEALCRRAKEQAALPRPKTPEIDWAMVCDPDYGMPAGDLVVRMDASGIAIDGASVSPSELGPRTEVVVAAAARAEDAFIDEIPPPPPPLGIGAPIPETKAVAELSLDASLTMEQVRPVLRALLDAGVTDVLLPVTGTRRSEGALPAKLVAEAPPPPPVGAPPSSPSVGVLGLMAPPTGEELARELAIFEVAKGTVTTRSTLRPEPQAHTAPSMSLLRDHMDGALVVYVIAADDSSWSEVAAVVGAACPQAAIVLAPHAP